MTEGIGLGDEVRDRITGLQGFVTARAEYISGNVKLLIEQAAKDGAVKEAWVDAERFIPVDDAPRRAGFAPS